MTEIEAIQSRHSVRNYIVKDIEAEKVKLLQGKIAELNVAGNLHLPFIADAGKTYNRLANKAMGLDLCWIVSQWLTVELGNVVGDDEIKNLIDLSFELTEKRQKQKNRQERE